MNALRNALRVIALMTATVATVLVMVALLTGCAPEGDGGTEKYPVTVDTGLSEDAALRWEEAEIDSAPPVCVTVATAAARHHMCASPDGPAHEYFTD